MKLHGWLLELLMAVSIIVIEILDDPGLIVVKVVILILLMRVVAIMTMEDMKEQKDKKTGGE